MPATGLVRPKRHCFADGRTEPRPSLPSTRRIYPGSDVVADGVDRALLRGLHLLALLRRHHRTRLDRKRRADAVFDVALLLGAGRTLLSWRTRAARDETKKQESGVVMIHEVVVLMKGKRNVAGRVWRPLRSTSQRLAQALHGVRNHDKRSQRHHSWHPTPKRLGIRRRRAYCTRRTYCTVTLMAGIKAADIAAQAGPSIKILLEVYARCSLANDGGTERTRLAEAMGGNGSPTRPNRSPEVPQSSIAEMKNPESR